MTYGKGGCNIVEKTILQYQKAFNSAIARFKKNKSILAVMVFGSIITGDLWDESDVDLFVIYDNNASSLINIYTEEIGIPIHIKFMSKGNFMQINDENLRGGFIHRIISSSRLVFSKDMEISSRYDIIRYYPDIDRERWNMVYVGKLIKNISICKKYLQNDGIYTAYIEAIKSIEEFSKLYVNSAGYMISKDAVSVAVNLNDKLKKYVKNLLFCSKEEKDIEISIRNLIEYFDENINLNISKLVNVLINYIKRKDDFLSSEQIKKDELFKEYDICMEEILDKLWKKNIIKKQIRDYKLEDGSILSKENVYFV